MKIIHRYLFRELVSSILLITLALLAMFAFFDLIQELDNIGKGDYGLGQALLFVLLSVPGHGYEVVPVGVLIGALYALARLSRDSELVVLRVSGVSMSRMAGVMLRVGLVFTLLTFLVGEMITPLSEKSAQRMRLKATDSVVTGDFRSGLWVKDGNSFINIEEVLPDAELLKVHIYEFDGDFRLRMISNAGAAVYKAGSWALSNVTQTIFDERRIRSQTFPEAAWKSVIQPELLNVLLVVPEKMSVWNLYSYIKHLAENHQKTTRYQIALWAKMTYPVASVVMVLLALPFGFLQQRASGVSGKIFAGTMLGILYQILNRLFQHIGLLNDWTPLVSAIIPTLLFLLVGVGMLFWVERR